MRSAPLLLLAALLAGCETVVDAPAPPFTQRLSLSYTLSNRSAAASYASLAESRSLYVGASEPALASRQPQGRADATVELRDASGQLVEVFRAKARSGYPDSARGFYVPTRGFAGQPGQRYTLRASAPGIAAVEATLTLPAPAVVQAGRFTLAGNTTNGYNAAGRLTFSLADAPATTDYYVAYARVLDAVGQYWGDVYQDYSTRNSDGPDIRLQRFDLSNAYSFYSILPVSDEGRNGQLILFDNDVRLYYNRPYDPQQTTVPPPAYLEVVVSTLPADTYQFYQSVQRYYDTDGSPFAEPAPLRSNVSGGYGLFGGATDTVLRIKL